MKIFSGKKKLVAAILFSIASGLYAQTFSEQSITLTGIDNGNAIWGDADNDGDVDILISGLDAGNSYIVKLYRNNGSNVYSDAGSVFSPAIPGVFGQDNTSAKWADFDNDGFTDLILNAPTSSGTNNILIYRHEADHTYLLKATIDYWTWQGNSIDCGDYDNDGDIDFMLGTSNSTRIFQNQGSFAFREQNSIALDGLTRNSCRFADYDNDGDLDIVMTGFKQLYNPTYRVYRNNGYDNFSLQAGINLTGFYGGSIDFGDYNSDGRLDLLFTGEGGYPKIFKYNSNNTYSIYSIGTLNSLSDGTAKWGDLDNDGDLDIVVSGSSSGSNITKVFFNNGNNTFAEQTGITIDGVFKASIDLYDYDKDNDLDILITGNNGLTKISKVFKNTSSTSNTVPGTPSGLSATINGNDIVLKWNSVRTDNTSYKGLSYNVMIGTSSGGINITSPASASDGFHRISGMGNGQLDTTYIIRNLPLSSTFYWKVQAIDNSAKGGAFASGPNFTYTTTIQAYGLNVPVRDGNSATLTWTRGNGSACAVFLKESNTGTASPANNISYTASSVFKSGTQINTSGWYCVYNGTLNSVNVTNLKANTDYIFNVVEYTAGPVYNLSSVSDNPLVFKTGLFSEIKTANLLPVSTLNYTRNNFSFWIDIDNDASKDLDLLIVGPSFTRLYRNDGANIFTLLAPPLTSGYYAACGDYDNDGLIDIVISASLSIRLYKNTGGGNFVEQVNAIPLVGDDGVVDWGDYDNDGDLDLIVTLSTSADGRISKIYKNNGGGSFTDQQSILLEGLAYGSAKWVDYDNDGFPDLSIAGGTNDAGYVTKIYRNNGKNNFSELTGMNFTGVSNGSIEWGDYDNDGDPDMLITGFNLFTSIAALYRNDGNLGFSLQSSSTEGSQNYLPPVNYGSAKFGDYDNDGDLDILITGFRDFYNLQITKIYKNNGDGTFAEDISSVLPGVGGSSASWGDYDMDGDLDIVLAGNTPDAAIAKIYRNDLNIVNTPPSAPASPASSVNLSDVTLKWKSVKSDNTPYKAMTYNLKVGTTSGGINILAPNSANTGLRRIVTFGNTGLDTVFTFKKMPFGTYYWSVQAVDNGFAGGPFSSEGSFAVSPTQASALSANIIDNNSLLLKWERGNGDRCVVFCKQTSTGQSVPVNNTSYVADPEFGFGGQIGSTGWYCIYNGRDDSVVVKGLIYNKLYSFHIIEYMGLAGSEQYFTQVADGNPGVFSTSLFTDQTGISLNSGLYNNVAWGDYDNDGFIDLLIPGIPTTRIYRNKGDNTFEEKTGIVLPAVNYGNARWGDYDGDGDLDIVITGATTSYPVSNPLTRIYRNDGSDVFTEQTSISIAQLLYSSVAWGDYDSDGDLDILINGAYGNDPTYVPVTKVYENNGNNTFSEQTQIALTPMFKGSVKWVDYDNDGDLDIAMSGAIQNTLYNEGVIKIFKNNGNKTFSEQTISGLMGSSFSYTSWGDFDNDGDLDFFITSRGSMHLYKNNGGNSFVEHLYFNLAFQGATYAEWGDYDNDGWLDFIISNPGLDTKIYRNTHGLSVPGALSQWFVRQDDDAVKSIGYSFVDWIDYDNDGDLDFLFSKESGIPSKIFRNNLIMRSGLFKMNNPPAAPSGQSYANTPQGVILKWDPPMDDKTPARTLTYNLRIGTSKNNFNITPSHSSESGFRQVPSIGNAQVDTTYLLIGMPAGKYYWNVQAIDQSYKGSLWSPVDSFEVKNVLAFFTADTVCQGLNTTFANQSVGFGETITSYKWIFESGVISTQSNPSYSFSSSGVKNVTLIAYSSNTSDTIVKQVLVKGKPLVDFSASTACLGIETALTNLSDITGLTITSWSWDYGDGRGSTAMNPGTHGYLNAGNYDVILSSAANNGCSNSITKTVTVAAYPQVSISATSPLSFCSGDSVRLVVTSYTNHTYRWMSDGVNITGGITNTITAKATGNYTVEVINLTGNCTTLSPAATVTVLNAPAAPLITYSGSNIICQNDSLLLNVTATPGYSYQWKLNGGAVGSNSSQHYAKTGGTYAVIVANINGCSVSSSNQIPVTVNPLPVVGNISQSGETKFCSGQSITLSVPPNSLYTYKWKKGNSETGSSSNNTTVRESGDYSVEVSTTLGCKITSLPLKIEVVNRPAKPQINTGSYKPDTCLGENPLKLSVKNVVPDYSYKWYYNGTPVGNSTFIETRDEGNYYLEALYDICKSDTASVNIDLKATLPKPEIIVKGPTIWYLTTPSKASLYKWYYNGAMIPGAESSTYVAGQKFGTYRVAISDASGCFAFSDTVKVNPLGITGFEETDPFKGVIIYPNPTTGLFTIDMNNNVFGELVIEIITQNGSKILNIKFEKTTEHFSSQIDLSGQSKGMYLINLSLDKFRAVRKVVVE